jgi:ketosteroid isomerase-like protein
MNTDDRVEIAEVLALHAHIFDANQLDRLDELFTPDAVYDMRPVGMGTFEGTDDIRVAAARMAASGHAPLAHYVTNIVITSSSDDDAATVQSKGLMMMSDGTFQGVMHADTVRRHNGNWRISRRIITPAPSAPSAHEVH